MSPSPKGTSHCRGKTRPIVLQMGYPSYSHSLGLGVVHACLHAQSLQSCPALSDPVNCTCQAPLSMRFPRSNPKNTGVSYRSLLPGIFLTQRSNLHLLHCRQILYHLSYQGQLVATGKKKKNSLVPVSLLYPNKFQVGRNLNVKGEK